MSAMLALAARRAARGRPRGPGRLAGAARSRGGGGGGGGGGGRGGPALHFCVVGSGPAGFYTAERLAKAFGGRARIDVLDRLPTPFGLVRYGVAPDHAATKSVINQFTASALEAANRIRFFGNVEVGRDVRVEELDRMYSALVLACGCPGDKRLGLRGEGLEGVLSAREFVSWYNGVPDWEKAPPDLGDVTDVAVIGQGNVALDCARLLLKGPERLGGTDITQGALAALRGSAVRRVHLVGRRGPAQASFTGKELREILGLEGCAVHVKAEDLELSDLDRAELKRSRIRKRVARIFADRARAGNPPGAAKGLHLHFFRQPVRFLGDGGRVTGVEVEKTTLEGGGGGWRARLVGRGRSRPSRRSWSSSQSGTRARLCLGCRSTSGRARCRTPSGGWTGRAAPGRTPSAGRSGGRAASSPPTSTTPRRRWPPSWRTRPPSGGSRARGRAGPR